jgi:molybdopterin-binding protein
VADLVGVNLLRGTSRGAGLDPDGGGRLMTTGDMSGPVLAVIALNAVSVHRGRPPPGTANAWLGRVGAVDLLGDRVRVRVDGTPAITAEVPPGAVDELKLDDGGSSGSRSRPPTSGPTLRDRLGRTRDESHPSQGGTDMQLSARNQLTGTVQNVKSGSVMAEITVNVDAGQVTAAITDASRERLGLKSGDQVSVVIKSTEVMIATP